MRADLAGWDRLDRLPLLDGELAKEHVKELVGNHDRATIDETVVDPQAIANVPVRVYVLADAVALPIMPLAQCTGGR